MAGRSWKETQIFYPKPFLTRRTLTRLIALIEAMWPIRSLTNISLKLLAQFDLGVDSVVENRRL